jgi:hypothetical protein
MLNTVPFLPGDWENAGEEVLAQKIELLARWVDAFELMCYHQILRRDATWPAAVADAVKARTDRQVLVTLQGQAEYLEPIYAGQGRAQDIALAEFQTALDAIARSQADGVVFFLWKDFLHREMEEGDQRWTAAVRAWRGPAAPL